MHHTFVGFVEPPLDDGAVHDTTLCRSAPLEAETLVETPGTVYDVAALDVLLVPDKFVAVAVNVCATPYVWPAVSSARNVLWK